MVESSEFLNRAREALAPGRVVEVTDLQVLQQLEDVILTLVEPQVLGSETSDESVRRSWLACWQQRPALRDLIRPQGVNGTIAQVSLEIMTEPYERLKDARQRGWKFPTRGISTSLDRPIKDHWVGFSLLADVLSLGMKRKGQIQAEAWYHPLGSQLDKAQYYNGGRPIKRFVTYPRWETAEFREFTAVRIGSSVLKQLLTDPALGRLNPDLIPS